LVDILVEAEFEGELVCELVSLAAWVQRVSVVRELEK